MEKVGLQPAKLETVQHYTSILNLCVLSQLVVDRDIFERENRELRKRKFGILQDIHCISQVGI